MVYTEIYLKMQNKMVKTQLIEGKAIIKNGVALTTYKDPEYTKKTFKALKKTGKACELKDNVIIELYEGESMEEITKKILLQIAQLKEKYKSIMNVTYVKVVKK